MPPTAVSPAELTDFEGLLEDDNAIEQIDYTPLEQFFAAIGLDTLANSAAWCSLLEIPPGVFQVADEQGDITIISRPTDMLRGRGHGPRESGYRASSLLEWVKKRNIPFHITRVGRAMLDAKPAEAIEVSRFYDADWVIRNLGIDRTAIDAAIVKGEISEAHHGRIGGQPLLDWLQRAQIEIKVSISLAQEIARQRFTDLNSPAAEVKPARPESVLDAVDEFRSSQRSDEQTDRAAMLQKYGEILRRRFNPQPGDARLLFEICDALGLSRDRLENDGAVLDRAAELLRLRDTLKAADKELNAAAADWKAIGQRHKQEFRDARSRLIGARGAHSAAIQADPELRSLKAAHPELFAD